MENIIGEIQGLLEALSVGNNMAKEHKSQTVEQIENLTSEIGELGNKLSEKEAEKKTYIRGSIDHERLEGEISFLQSRIKTLREALQFAEKLCKALERLLAKFDGLMKSVNESIQKIMKLRQMAQEAVNIEKQAHQSYAELSVELAQTKRELADKKSVLDSLVALKGTPEYIRQEEKITLLQCKVANLVLESNEAFVVYQNKKRFSLELEIHERLLTRIMRHYIKRFGEDWQMVSRH